MSIPIVEHIAANIKTAIDAITTGNSFNQTLVAVRPMRNDFKDVLPEDGKVLIVQIDEEEAEEPIGVEEWRQPFILMAIVLDGDDVSTPIDTRINQVRADIHKKLKEDPTRGGYAIDTTFAPSRFFEGEKKFTGIAIPAVVHYRTKYDDPYTLG